MRRIRLVVAPWFGFVAGVAGTLLLASCGTSGAGSFGSVALVQITTASVPPTFTGQEDYSFFFTATIPHAPGTFLVSGGMLPPGMALDRDTGELHGVPRVVGLFSFELAARDGNDPAFPAGRDQTFAEDRKPFQVVVTKGAPNLLNQTIPTAQYRGTYSYQIDAAGGTTPYTFTDISVPPAGLGAGMTVSPSGLIGNFPTSMGSNSGHFTFTVRLTDADGNTDTATYALNVVIKPLIILTPTPLTSAAALFPYSQTMQLASDGAGAPFTWSQVPPVAGETLLANVDMEITPAGVLQNVFASAGPKLNPPPPLPASAPYTITFTLNVKDEANQPNVNRTYQLTVNPGPVLTGINPKSSTVPGPFTATGLNFQPGATLIFKPGAGQVVVAPNFGGATSLTFANAPPTPSGAAGSVPVMVLNPDGGSFTLPNAFAFPASTISFGQKGFIADNLSSFGLDCADVTGDGKADIVHCGYAGFVPFAGYSVTSSKSGLDFLKNNGNLTFTTTVLSANGYTGCRFVDVDTDGDLDIVAIRPGFIDTWLNNGTGTFTPGPSSSVSAPPSGITSDLAIGKFNGDSIPDVVWGSGGNTYGGTVFVALGNGSGGFTQTASSTSGIGAFYGTNSMVALDVNGDAIDDLVVGPGYYSSTYPWFYRMQMASGGTFGGSWTASPNYSSRTWGGVRCVRSGNFLNLSPAVVESTIQDPPDSGGPGGCELAICSGNLLATKTTLSIPSGVTKNIGVGDFDFDGVADFAVSAKICVTGGTSAPTGGTCDLVYFYKGKTGAQIGTLNIAAGAPTLTFANAGRVASGDLDGDGRPDLLITTSYWATDNQSSTYYQTADSADGNAQGIVFYLNSSN